MSYADNPRASGNPPKGSDIPPQPVGHVTSDSLAAESLNQGGDFAGGDAVPLAVKGNQSTLNNTDSSSAVPLHAASSGAARERQDERGADSDERGAAGMKYPDALGGQGISQEHTIWMATPGDRLLTEQPTDTGHSSQLETPTLTARTSLLVAPRKTIRQSLRRAPPMVFHAVFKAPLLRQPMTPLMVPQPVLAPDHMSTPHPTTLLAPLELSPLKVRASLKVTTSRKEISRRRRLLLVMWVDGMTQDDWQSKALRRLMLRRREMGRGTTLRGVRIHLRL